MVAGEAVETAAEVTGDPEILSNTGELGDYALGLRPQLEAYGLVVLAVDPVVVGDGVQGPPEVVGAGEGGRRVRGDLFVVADRRPGDAAGAAGHADALAQAFVVLPGLGEHALAVQDVEDPSQRDGQVDGVEVQDAAPPGGRVLVRGRERGDTAS